MSLEGFTRISPMKGKMTVTFTKDGISFNANAVQKLKCPSHVLALLDKDACQLAIVPCEVTDQDAWDFWKPGKNSNAGVRWMSYDLRSTIDSLMGWNTDKVGMKAAGRYQEEDNALIFNLSQAAELPPRKKPSDKI